VQLSLTRIHTIARIKLYIILPSLYLRCGMHHGSNKHLASDDETNLDCCEVIVIIVDYDMAIITLQSLYIVLSCRLTPADALSVLYG
jgi:hypothetical protein